MLQSNELRVGNFLKFNNHIEKERIVQVNLRFFGSWAAGISIDEMKFDEKFNIYYSPIPLTPEILEKCGFEIVVELHPTYLIGKGAIVLHVTKQSGKYWHCIVYNNYEDELSERWAGIGNVQYLHQLQNLYFALIGEELKVNF